MRTKLHVSRHEIRDLLEIQREATQGTYFVKDKETMPILATYVLDEKCYLLFDIPRGQSKCISLEDVYDVARIKLACEDASMRLPLPRAVQEPLEEWWQDNPGDAAQLITWEQNYCWWEDSIRGLEGPSQLAGPTNPEGVTKTSKEIYSGHFPFEISSIDKLLAKSQDGE